MTELYESTLLSERYERMQHACGLPIYVFPKKMSTTYAMLAVKYGSVDNILDGEGTPCLPDGVAHFLEHKLFANEDGTDSFEKFSDYGADANAYTAHSRTVYLFSCTDRFEDSLGELLDFVTHPCFTEESVARERGIIGEEIRMCMDDPYDRCYHNMLKGLYRHHPVKREICGSEASIAAITPEVLYKAYNAYYTPSNMALIVCGDVTGEEVWRIANTHLPSKQATCQPKRYTVAESFEIAAPRTEAFGQVAKPIFAIGVKDVTLPTDPEGCSRRDAAMGILSEMLFSDTGTLYNRLLDAALISPELSYSYEQSRDFGFLRISGESHDPDRVLSEILRYLDEIRHDGLLREDFEHCKRIAFAEYIKGFDSTEEIADNLAAFLFEGAEIFSFADVLQEITFEEICAIFDEFFDPKRFTLSVIRPQ